MAMVATMKTTTLIAACLLLLLIRLVVAAAAASSTEGCTDELISFSACLSYISDPPNNLTESASDKCCDAFYSAIVESASALCLCYFLRYPNILGFPLNTTRLLSLSSICTPPPSSLSPSPYAPPPPPPSLNFLCSASPALPPLNSAATLGITEPDSESRGRGRSRGRMTPKTGGKLPPRSDPSGKEINFPVANGPLALPSTGFCHSNIFLLPWILAILNTLLW